MITITNGLLSADFSEIGASVTNLRFDNKEIATRGVIIGRYANRIAGGKFTLNGIEYQLPLNDPDFPNTLHGGTVGFDRRIWTCSYGYDTPVIEFKYVSIDTECGFPGNLSVKVRYTLTQTSLKIEYSAKSDKDTVFNPTNHIYFNLGDVFSTKLQIFADSYTPVDHNKIPTGEYARVQGTEFDFTSLRPIAQHYDHCFTLRERLAAVAVGDLLTMKVYTDMPSMQLYTENDAFCLETQFPANLMNPRCVLKAGDMFISATEYEFTKK